MCFSYCSSFIALYNGVIAMHNGCFTFESVIDSGVHIQTKDQL